MPESYESTVIVEYLSALSEGGVQLYYPGFSQYLQTIKAHGLVVNNGMRQHLSRDGYEVLRLGSFDKWLENKEKKEAELHQATLSTAKATVDAAISAKWSQYAAFVAAIAALGAFLAPFLTPDHKQTENNSSEKKADSTLSVMRGRLNRLDSLVKIQTAKPAKPTSNKPHKTQR